ERPGPRLHAAVEETDIASAEVAEDPPRPGGALRKRIVVDDDLRIRAQAQLAEGVGPRLGILGRGELLAPRIVIDPRRSGEMAGVVLRPWPGVEEADVGRLGEIGGLDQEIAARIAVVGPRRADDKKREAQQTARSARAR